VHKLFAILFLLFFFQSNADTLDIENINKKLVGYSNIEKIDTLLQLSKTYSQTSFEKSFFFAKKTIALCQSIGNYEKEIDALHVIAINHSMISQYDKSLKYFKEALEISEKHKYIRGIGKSHNGLGVVCKNTGELALALEHYQKSIKISEKLNEKAAVSMTLSNIGNIYLRLGKYNKALDSYNESLKIAEEITNRTCISNTLNNLGLLYLEMGKYDFAIVNFKRSLNIKLKEEDKFGIARSYQNIGDVYIKWGNKEMAIDYYTKSFKIENEMGNKQGIAISLMSIGSVYFWFGDYNNAIKFQEQSLDIAQKADLIYEIKDSYKALSRTYDSLKILDKSFYYYKQYIIYKDSIFNNESQRKIIELQTIYETEKKDKEIQLQNVELEKSEVIIKKQRILTYTFIIGFIIVSFFMIIIFRFYKQKKSANILLTIKNEEIMQQKEEIEAQRDEITAQRDLVVQQRDLISEQKQDITDSIEYAYRIQSAIFPTHDDIKLIINEYFILYKPRDIVSGDFYWVGKQNEKLIILAADCTGHGVPGAFMSMLGIAFLNEIVNKEIITRPSEILNKLRDKIIKALKQKGKIGEQRDGMDVAVITIDLENKILKFAGANNPLYLIRNNELIEQKGNKMPVSIYYKMDGFTTHEIPINKGDNIYIFTDGYADQFGGPKGKKFKYKAFKELLRNNANKPMNEQKEILDKTLINWQGKNSQIDDILIIGIKI